MVWLELKDDLEPAPTKGSSNQLIPIYIRLVSPDLETGEEALHCFLKRDTVGRKFVVFEVIFPTEDLIQIDT